MTRGRAAALALVVALVPAVGSGCGVARLQTARTVPAGLTRTTVGMSAVYLGDRGSFDLQGLPAVPIDLMVRHGASERVDWGVRLFFGLGALADVKWNLLAPERPTALAISAGLGGAVDAGTVIHVPVTLTASRTVSPSFTPYAAVGYGTYWIFGYGDRDPMQSYAPRTGTGDGLLMLHAGIELATVSGRAVFFEYTIDLPVVNDPGDFYGFGVNQFFSIAFRTGNRPR